MSDAYEAIMNLTEDDIAAYTATPETEEHIVIGPDRRIIVPESLKRIAVQYDHNIETVTFDCIRYWDDHDMSEMQIYINYLLPNGSLGSYIADNVTADGDLMHFDWTISNVVTQFKGNITFLVCAKKTNIDGNEENHWNSERNSDMVISEGLECGDVVISENPDIITQLLARMDVVEEISVKADEIQTYVNFARVSADTATIASNEAVGHRNAAEKFANETEEYMKTTSELLDTKANAVVRSEIGSPIILTDSSDDRIRGLRVMGRTKQTTTSGKNLVDMSDYEFDDSNYTHTLYANESKSANDLYNFMRSHPGENIIYSMTVTGTASGIDIGSISFYGEENVLICDLVPNITHEIKADLPETFTASYIYGSTNGASVSNIQVEFGTEVTEYEPYTGAKPSPSPEYPQTISSGTFYKLCISGKNIFDMSKFVSTDTITILDNSSLSVSHYYNPTTIRLNQFASTLQVGETYRITLDTDGCTFIYLNDYGHIWNSGATLTITDDILNSPVTVYGANEQVDGSTIIRSIQITHVDMNSDYEEYKEIKSEIFSVSPLLSIPVLNNGTYTDTNGQQWYCDEIDLERGVLIKRCRKETLTFTPQTELNRYTATLSKRANPAVAIDNGIPVISNKYKFDPLAGSGTPMVNGIRVATTSPNYVIAYYDGQVIENANIIYPLETPEVHELPDEFYDKYRLLRTYYPNTIITNTYGLDMCVSYNADTETYIDSVISSNIEQKIEDYMNDNPPEFDGSNVDLTGYAKSSDIPTKVSQLTNDSGFIDSSALTGYAKTTDIPTVPTKVSQLTNDSGYAKTSDIPTVPTKVSDLDNDSGFITNGDLTGYAKTTDIPIVPTKISQLSNDSGFIDSSALTGYAKTTDIPTVPTKVSQLTNDSGYAKTSEIPTKVSQLTNDSGYAKTSDIPIVPTKVSQLTNDSGYAKTSDIPAVPTKTSQLTNDSGFIDSSALTGYAKTAEVPTKTSQLTNDSSYAKTSDIPTVPTKVSQLTNDSGYAKTTELPTKVSQLANDSKFVSESALEESKKLKDTATGDFYSLSVVNGKLTLTKLED